ncbi:MAG: cyanophycinase [Acidobacteriota bacterium]|nr:cyanophycinase [Acidobacteriota bacterium]
MKYTLPFLSLLFLLALPVRAQGTIMIAGGGSEGDQGDTSSWSYKLYQHLLTNGDTDGDGIIRTAILTESLPSNPSDAEWMPNYMEWIGSTLGLNVVATNYEVKSKNDANKSNVVGDVADADAIFIKGGDQGAYYDLWNGTLLETHIRTAVGRGASIGGTSAGAMSMSEYCLCGSMDMISDDVLTDSHTSYLNDASDGGSGIHTDFLSFLANVAVETHFTERGRLGRMAGVLAKASDDFNNNGILSIGLERQTGVFINGNVAEVVGIGAVTFLHQSSQTSLVRTAGEPLYFTDLVLDRLTEGWQYNISTKTPLTGSAPSGTVSINPTLADRTNSGALTINGNTDNDKEKFGHYGDIYPDDYARVGGSADPYVKDSVGFTDITSSNRADKHETLYRLLYDQPADVGFLVYPGAVISRTAGTPDVIEFGSGMASLVIDTADATHKGLSPYTSNWASSGGSLKAASFVGARLHIMADTATHETGYDTRTHQIVTVTGGGGNPGGGIAEIEPNDSRGSAHDLRSESWPITVTGTIATTNDRDYFKIELGPRETLTAALDVPAGLDYDLYLLDNRGRTVVRSVNDGSGVNESLTYTNGRRARTYYVEIESYSGASGSNSYQLDLSK